ncbi:MAG: Protein of unknown function (DUF1553), partial [Verrucomicrobia bacterium]
AVLAAARKAFPATPKNTFSQPAPRLLADYTKTGATPFLQDGSAFGNGPAIPGAVFAGTSATAPIAAIVTHGAARRDPAWKNIVSKGETDPGTLKVFQRSGQTLRTPEFTLGGNSLWYLVRGAGRAYAVVHSHLMIQGPLHGKVLTTWKDSGTWEWVQHNLSTYQGSRAHVELLPDGSGDFEVAMVAEAEQKPEMPEAFKLSGAPVSNEALQALFLQTLGAMETNTLANAPLNAIVADWIVRSLDLLCPPGSPQRAGLAATTEPLIERHNATASTFKLESALATAMFEGSGADEFLLKRGSPKSPGPQVPRRFVEAIAGSAPLVTQTGSGRRELAGVIASPSNPLTSRVIVNRVWHHLFGKGIVPTVDNFGVLGQSPSHQELLDTLAVRFVNDQHWSLKALIRELVLSSAYAMSSSPASKTAEEADPENTLLHRMNLKRLEGEAIRDSILAVSGRLDLKEGGPSVPIYLTPFMEGRGKPKSGPLDGEGRRTLYVAVKRNFLSPMMLAFDTPIPFNSMGRRNVSNVPAQSLVLMNDPFVVSQAALWVKNLPSALPPTERLRRMYLAAFSREPLAEESTDALLFLREQAQSLNLPEQDPKVWADLAHVLFNAKEFIHLN